MRSTNRFSTRTLFWLFATMALASAAPAPRKPDIGYLYPAGGQQGSTIQVKLSGQYLDGVSAVDISGDGIQATVLEHVKPLNGRQINLLRDRLKELQRGLFSSRRSDPKVSVRNSTNTNLVEKLDRATVEKEVAEIRKKLANPKNRARENPQLSEDVTLRLVIEPNAELGERAFRLRTATGLSNPLVFHVGRLPEYAEKEPNNKPADAGALSRLPAIINGQILPGDVDWFRFELRQGTRLVVQACARQLMPYLADAVPGWFQATLALSNAKGEEVAYVDDFRFHPDPVLFCEVPEDGQYLLEIKDAIYRGREDFVYRITVGELPFVTSIFPLGGAAGGRTKVELKGWNLPTETLAWDATDQRPGTHSLSVRRADLESNPVPFAVDTLPESHELEPNDEAASAQRITAPVIVNGRIDRPGDCDVFQFQGRAGEQIVAEVNARRLNSPLDSVLQLTDAAGRQLAFNDDDEDKADGWGTHHADARLATKLPADGIYHLHLGDIQRKGGTAYAYRLRISPPRPDFELRIVPASLNARAGATVPVTVYALRKDGFADEITLSLKNAPQGVKLSSGRIPGDKDEVKLSVTVPFLGSKEPFSLDLEGRATIAGRQVVRPVVPAEDMMQAFIYRHLVPTKDLRVAVLGRGLQGPLRGFGKKSAAVAPKSKSKAK